jgi:hypothetical protein
MNETIIPQLNFEYMDAAVFLYFEKKYPLIIDSRKVPVVWATPERWVQIQRDSYLKDENGVAIVPLITIRRGSPEVNRNRYVPKISETSILVRPMEATKYDSNANKTFFSNDVIYSIPYPRFVNMNYTVIIWTSYFLDINEIQQRYLWEGIDHIFEYERFWYTGTLQSISENSNNEDNTKSERIQKVEYNFMVEGYISDNRDIKKFTPLRKSEFELLTYENVDDIKVNQNPYQYSIPPADLPIRN